MMDCRLGPPFSLAPSRPPQCLLFPPQTPEIETVSKGFIFSADLQCRFCFGRLWFIVGCPSNHQREMNVYS